MNISFKSKINKYIFLIFYTLNSSVVFAQTVEMPWQELMIQHGELMMRGQHDLSIEVAQRALFLAKEKLGKDHLQVSNIFISLAKNYRATGQYDLALQAGQRALDIRQKILESNDPDIAVSLADLAATQISLGKYNVALELSEQALEIQSKTGSPAMIVSMNQMALASFYLGRYEEALKIQKALADRFEKDIPDSHFTATALSNLAGTYQALNQSQQALKAFQKALIIFKATLGQEHPYTLTGMSNVATELRKLGEYDKSLDLQVKVVALNQKVLGLGHPNTGLSLSNLATIYEDMEQYEKALENQQKALRIIESSLGKTHPSNALILEKLGYLYGRLGQNDVALSLEIQALGVNEQAFGPDHPRTAGSLSGLAVRFVRLGQTELAISLFKSSVNSLQKQRALISRIGEAELNGYTMLVASTYQDLAALLVKEGRLLEAQLVLDMLKENEQFDFIRRNTSADPRRTRIGYNTTEQSWMTRYRQIADQLSALGVEEQALQKQAKLGLSATQKERLSVLRSDLLVAQAAFRSFLKEMQTGFERQGQSKAAEASETSLTALAELQGLLKGVGQDVVLLQYYVTDDKVGMLLTTPGVQLARSASVSSKDLNRQIAEFRRLLRDPKADVLKASQALYQLLVAPVAKDLGQSGAKTVMLSLDGALRYLPFGALHDGKRYIAERWNLPIYTSVTKNRLRDAVTPNWTAAGLGVTLALGDFAALPAVRAEMNSIVKTASGGLLPGEVYLDKAFTAQRLQDVSQRPFQLLHVASHFQFSPGTEVNSFLLLGDGKQLTLGDIRTQNYRFDNVDLLTLSACDTGLGGGRDAQGKEIEGFGVLAQQQGAKAVLATLWPVADASTAALMAEMYRRRQAQSLTKIEALRQAQLSLLSTSKYAHPHYWAPFILMGNWK
jgi:CHAT domain-containing protein